MKWALNADYEVFAADRAGAAGGPVRAEHPTVAFLDLGLPPNPPSRTRDSWPWRDSRGQPGPKVIVITGQGEKENALRAVGEGAYDFLNKPIDIGRAEDHPQARRPCRAARSGNTAKCRPASGGCFEGMLGNSPEIQKVFAGVSARSPPPTCPC